MSMVDRARIVEERVDGSDRSTVTTAPLSGASDAGNAVPGRAPTASSSSPASSVASNPPNIPNVVEYHLKVKPGQTQRVIRVDDTDKKQEVEEMKKEKSPTPASEKKKDLVSKLSRLTIDNNVFEGSTDLPQVFQVKYLGSHDARGLWGIKHTRRPVDNMVAAAKALPTNTMLPLIKLVVSQEGVVLLPVEKKKQDPNFARMYAIETISYGVQDLIYTRVFSMIVVRETENFRRVSPFECHGFVCESKHHARQLTYALATAFEIYSRTVKAQDKMAEMAGKAAKNRFAIDLRSPEEIEADLATDSEA
ncbi:uncharacterized protein LOC108627880 isoform X2 [Ceratina calcarata]|uniref:Uncharacterized protein LOC108627880 isoform X2 n=1 Tax=Ceratina calcarata TaxID=156304 RepID=A0AAJ7S548_9HYME|nr:uncharacterized protein LOC108627880 isoform X2 [Ceratina calcarata]